MKIPREVLKPVEEHLKSQEKKLIKRKRSLEKEDPYRDTDRLIDNAAIDADAAEEVGHERVFALKAEIDKTLIRIRKTLTRIKVGKYGLCLNCRKMIDTDRLAIDPTVRYCINCQKKVTDKN